MFQVQVFHLVIELRSKVDHFGASNWRDRNGRYKLIGRTSEMGARPLGRVKHLTIKDHLLIDGGARADVILIFHRGRPPEHHPDIGTTAIGIGRIKN
jgi:hypothetical protein